MPKFLMKNGCCYIPPVETDSIQTTCQVFANPHFNHKESDALCKGKSCLEFAKHGKQVSWGYLDDTDKNENAHSNRKMLENSLENYEKNLSLFTIFGNHTHHVSDASIYRPTTIKIEQIEVSSSEKLLDCISTCFWKCSSWCQKIEK